MCERVVNLCFGISARRGLDLFPRCPKGQAPARTNESWRRLAAPGDPYPFGPVRRDRRPKRIARTGSASQPIVTRRTQMVAQRRQLARGAALCEVKGGAPGRPGAKGGGDGRRGRPTRV